MNRFQTYDVGDYEEEEPFEDETPRYAPEAETLDEEVSICELEEAKLKEKLQKVRNYKQNVQKRLEEMEYDGFPSEEDIMTQRPCARCYILLAKQIRGIKEQYASLIELQDQVNAEKNQVEKDRLNLEMEKVSSLLLL